MKESKGKNKLIQPVDAEFFPRRREISLSPDQVRNLPPVSFSPVVVPALVTRNPLEPLYLGHALLRGKDDGPPLSYYPEYIDKSDNTGGQREGNQSVATNVATVGLIPGLTRKPLYERSEFPENSRTARDYARTVQVGEYIPRCSGVFITGGCGKGHRHLKAIVCSREWCIDCGRSGSLAHRRRVARWQPKYDTFDTVGYLVVTVPEELRNEFKDKDALSEFRRYVRRKLQRSDLSGTSHLVETPYNYTTKAGKKRVGIRRSYRGYDRGFIRYHYAGDCPTCKGKGCPSCAYTGGGNVWKPHLNILLKEGYINPDKLAGFKRDIAIWFQNRFKMPLRPTGNVYYGYTREPGKKKHRLNYVTRATWRFFVPEICDVIKGFHTAASWGKFKCRNPETATEAGEAGCCIHCIKNGELNKITWGTKLTRAEAEIIIGMYRHEGDGYYTGHTDLDYFRRE